MLSVRLPRTASRHSVAILVIQNQCAVVPDPALPRSMVKAPVEKQESPADAGIPARRKNDEKKSWEIKIPPFRSYNKFQSSRKSGVYSN